MLVADAEAALVLTGTGDVLEPESAGEGSVMGIGSGGNYALAAGRALLTTDLDAEAIARRALEIAAGHLRLHQQQFRARIDRLEMSRRRQESLSQ